jgi:hypothetical protein
MNPQPSRSEKGPLSRADFSPDRKTDHLLLIGDYTFEITVQKNGLLLRLLIWFDGIKDAEVLIFIII